MRQNSQQGDLSSGQAASTGGQAEPEYARLVLLADLDVAMAVLAASTGQVVPMLFPTSAESLQIAPDSAVTHCEPQTEFDWPA